MKHRVLSLGLLLFALLLSLSACRPAMPTEPVASVDTTAPDESTEPDGTTAADDATSPADTENGDPAQSVVTAGDFRTEVFADGHMVVSYDPASSTEASSPLQEPMTFTCSALPKTDSPYVENRLARLMFRTELDGVAFVLLGAGMNQSRYDVFVTADGGKTFTVLCRQLHISGMIDSAAYGDAGLLCVSAEGADRAHAFLLPTEPVTGETYTPTYRYLTDEHAIGTHDIQITAVSGSQYTVTWTTPDGDGIEQPHQTELSFS